MVADRASVSFLLSLGGLDGRSERREGGGGIMQLYGCIMGSICCMLKKCGNIWELWTPDMRMLRGEGVGWGRCSGGSGVGICFQDVALYQC